MRFYKTYGELHLHKHLRYKAYRNCLFMIGLDRLEVLAFHLVHVARQSLPVHLSRIHNANEANTDPLGVFSVLVKCLLVLMR